MHIADIKIIIFDQKKNNQKLCRRYAGQYKEELYQEGVRVIPRGEKLVPSLSIYSSCDSVSVTGKLG